MREAIRAKHGDGVAPWRALAIAGRLLRSEMRQHLRYQTLTRGPSDRRKAKGLPKKAFVVRNLALRIGGSPTWTRTRDLRINSPSLYQLSYQGTALHYSQPRPRRQIVIALRLGLGSPQAITAAMASATRWIFPRFNAATQIRPLDTA